MHREMSAIGVVQTLGQCHKGQLILGHLLSVRLRPHISAPAIILRMPAIQKETCQREAHSASGTS